MKWVVEGLSGTHVRDHFRCGQSSLDDYIRKNAGQHSRKNVGRTFVAVAPCSRQVLGYYAVSSSSVAFEHAPPKIQQKLPRYPIPVALLGKLVVDQSVQGQGLGEFLLMDALRRIVEVAAEMAIFAVEVHALNESAEAFYLKYGFQHFQDQPSHLFLTLATIKGLF